MHLHNVEFRVLSRSFANGTVGVLRPEELTLKDTVFVGPYERVSVLVEFVNAHIGRFPYHCHALTHEDYSMMRQFFVVNRKERCNHDLRCQCGEDCVSCPSDCSLMSGERCGDGVCEVEERKSQSCQADCVGPNVRMRMIPTLPSCQGDLLCEGEETPENTPTDCFAGAVLGSFCGDCFCDENESNNTCSIDCVDESKFPPLDDSMIQFNYSLNKIKKTSPLGLPLLLLCLISGLLMLAALAFLFVRKQFSRPQTH